MMKTTRRSFFGMISAWLAWFLAPRLTGAVPVAEPQPAEMWRFRHTPDVVRNFGMDWKVGIEAESSMGQKTWFGAEVEGIIDPRFTVNALRECTEADTRKHLSRRTGVAVADLPEVIGFEWSAWLVPSSSPWTEAMVVVMARREYYAGDAEAH